MVLMYNICSNLSIHSHQIVHAYFESYKNCVYMHAYIAKGSPTADYIHA